MVNFDENIDILRKAERKEKLPIKDTSAYVHS